MKKRLFSLLLTMVMVVTLLPVYTLTARAAETVTVKLESPRGLEKNVTIDAEATVADLKDAVAELCGVTFGDDSEYRLFGEDLKYPNSALNDDTKILREIGFADGQTIHLEKSTSWDASGSESIKIFGLTITGGTGSQEPYGDYNNVDYYWNYALKTIIIRMAQSSKNITISGTADHGTHIVVKSGTWKYLTLNNVTMSADGTGCITVNNNAKLDLTLKGTNSLTTGPKTEYGVEQKNPAIELNQADSQLRIKDGGNGVLTATSTCDGMPGIGTSGDDQSVGKITFNAGTVIANGGPGGPGLRSSSLYMKGGKLTANGGEGSAADIYLYDQNTTKAIQINNAATIVAETVMADVDGYVNVNENTDIDTITAPDVYFNTDADTVVYGNAWYPMTSELLSAEGTGIITIPDDGFTMNEPTIYGKAGETITVEARPYMGYDADVVKANDDILTVGEDYQYSFAMPNRSVKITASFKTAGHAVIVNTDGNGIVGADKTEAREGEKVTLTVSPNLGYELASITVWQGSTTVEVDGDYTFTMPAGDVTVAARFKKISCLVQFLDWDGDVLQEQNVVYGDAATAPAVPQREGYTFTGWDTAFDAVTTPLTVTAQYTINKHNIIYTVDGEEYARVEDVACGTVITPLEAPTKTGHTFSGWSEIPAAMPDEDVTVSGSFAANVYAITLVTNGGDLQGEAVTDYTYGVGAKLPDDPVRPGYLFAGWYQNPEFTGEPVTEITATDLGNKVYYAKWRLNPIVLLPLAGAGCVCDGYVDVNVGAWYHDAVDYVLENGLMNGLHETAFAPNGTMTRAMVWTVLGRMAGQEFTGTGENWYAEARDWAVASGISDGTNPNGAITREELVTMLWRFVGQPAAAESGLHWYSDAAEVSDWAADAMAWAVERNILQGSNYELSPKDTALRAQVAAILMRYLG